MQIISTSIANEHAAYLAAVACAERRALHSFFDQHVIEDDNDGFIAIDEGDYDALPMGVIDRVVHTDRRPVHRQDRSGGIREVSGKDRGAGRARGARGGTCS